MRSISWVALLAYAVTITACSKTVAVAAPISVVVSPRAVTIDAGTSTGFTAVVRGAGESPQVVTWSVLEAGGGFVDGTGQYRAPTSGGVFHVEAASLADPTKTDSGTVTVLEAVAVVISPKPASVTTGGALAFTATVTGTKDGQSRGVTWKVTESGGGKIDGAGKFTAPAAPGTFHVVASSIPEPAKSDTSTVTVTPQPFGVVVSPGVGLAVNGGTLAFSALVTGLAAGQSDAVTWSVRESGCGTVDASGGYSAPDAAGTCHVVATSALDAARSDAATVYVSATPLLPADRLTSWNPGLSAIGGIPARGSIFKTLQPSGGDDTAQVQAALDECPANQVVLLSPGTFKVSGDGLAISHSNVVLRGAGPAATRITRTDKAPFPIVIVGNRWSSDKYLPPLNLAADGLKGARSITLASAPTPPLTPGEVVHLDQLTDPAITHWGDHSPPGDPSRGWFSRPDRPVSQNLEVSSADGTKVTFATPLHISFQKSFAAQLSRYGETAVLPATRLSGVEDLYVENGKGGDGGGNIHLFVCAYCWVKNVEAAHSLGTSVNLDACFRSEVRDSFFHTSDNPSPGGDGYLIGVNSGSADNLIENNISWNGNKVMVMRASGGGNVVAYNYMEDGWGAGYPTIPEVGLNASHMTTAHYELFEGNQSFNFDGDDFWGNAVYITAFRNHLTGQRRSIAPLTLTDAIQRRVVGVPNHHWWYSFVGNVLGYAGQTPYPMAAFVYEAKSGANDPVSMWRIAWDNPVQDASVVSTLLRQGNFDFVSNAIHWDTGEKSMPPSLYLKSKPGFFGTRSWPWVTPENAAAPVATLPARARFDALSR